MMGHLFPVQLLLCGAMAVMAHKKGYSALLWTVAGGSIISLYFLWRLPNLSGFDDDNAFKKKRRWAGNRMALLLVGVSLAVCFDELAHALAIIGAELSTARFQRKLRNVNGSVRIAASARTGVGV